MILLSGSVRCGTSMMLELLSTLRKPSFSAFEPLWSFEHRKDAKMNNMNKLDSVKTYLEDLFECNFDGGLNKRLFSLWMQSTVGRKSLPEDLMEPISVRSGEMFLQESCKTAALKVVKTVRMSTLLNASEHASVMTSLLRRYPNLSVVGLIRDPRSVYFSKLVTLEETFSSN